MQELIEQGGILWHLEKTKEGISSVLIAGKYRAGMSCQPSEEASRNAHWENAQGGGAGGAGAQRATGQEKQNSKQKHKPWDSPQL